MPAGFIICFLSVPFVLAFSLLPDFPYVFSLQPDFPYVSSYFHVVSGEQRTGSLQSAGGIVVAGGNDAVSVMIGAELKNFFLGYSFDYPISNISKASSGSHEVFLRYNIKLDLSEKNKNKHKSIRIM